MSSGFESPRDKRKERMSCGVKVRLIKDKSPGRVPSYSASIKSKGSKEKKYYRVLDDVEDD